MWLFTPDSFISLVQHRGEPGRLLARARFPGDLGRVFPNHAQYVEETPDADYRYRLVVAREEVAHAVATAARGIDYTNFKDEASARPAGHFHRIKALHQVWSALLNAQAGQHTRSRRLDRMWRSSPASWRCIVSG